MSLVLTGSDLTRGEVVQVARGAERVELPAESIERMRAARGVVEAAVERGEAVYGVTTGVASRRRVRVGRDEIADFNRMLLRSHLIGQGADAPDDVVRAAMLRLANGFASGSSGVRPEVAERLVSALNEEATPRVRQVGSIGVGDLAPNADLAFALFADFPLAAGEALWLLNSNSFSTGFAALAVADTERLLATMHVSGALAFEGFLGNVLHLHPHVVRTRPSSGLRKAHERLNELLEDSALWDHGVARNLQDPLTFRGLPQVLAALHDALEFADGQIVLLTRLREGQHATVLQLPAAPRTEDAEDQKRLAIVA